MSKRQKKRQGNPGNQGNLVKQLIKQLLPSILTAIISAVVVGYISHLSWSAQYKTNLEDKIDEKKFEVYKQVSSNMARHQSLLYSKLKVQLTAYTESGGKVPTVEEYKEHGERLKKNLPLEYQNMLEYDNNLPELYGSFFMAEAMFGEATENALKNYLDNIINKSPEQYLNEYLAVANLQSGQSHTINITDIIAFVEPIVNAARERIMVSMRDEIGAFK